MDPSPKPTEKKRERGAERERKKKKGALDRDQDAAKYHKVDDMFKALSMKSKKDVATTSGYNTRAAASAGEPSASSEELAAALPAGGDDSGIAVQADPILPSDSSEEPTGGTPLTKMDTEEKKSEKHDQYPKELHDVPHSFFYTCGSPTGEEVTVCCDRSQTIMDVLMTCPRFKVFAQNNVGKELVIVRGKPESLKAISAHCPCCLIDLKEHLIIKFIKPKGTPQHLNSVSVLPGTTRNDLVVFHVEKDGRILVNTALTAKQAKLLSVYAYKRETIEEALKRDGRFKTDNFSILKDIKKHNRTINISSLVDDHHGKTFKVVLDTKNIPLEKQSNSSVPSSSTNTSMTSPSTSSAQQSATNVPVYNDTPEQTAKQKPRPIADSEEILAALRRQFPDLVKRMQDRKGKSKTEKELFRVEYGKSDKICKTVKMQKRLMDRADSVCQVRVEGIPLGSGFLLFDKFILTCAHVIYDKEKQQLRQPLTVSFCFEDLLDVQPISVPVKPEPVVFEKLTEKLTDDSECFHDFALLELDSAPTQSGLLEYIVTSPQRGGICIIGHPGGGVKETDPCFIIPVDDREKVVLDRCNEVQLQLITGQYFDFLHLVNQSPCLAYDTCFSEGASGSPVFDESHNVVAMHTGGYVYDTEEGQPQRVYPQSFIEYAQPLSSILPRIIIQIVERKKFDVLKAFLQYTSVHKNVLCDQVKEEVKRIANMQNLTEVKEILENYELEKMETD